MKAVVILLVLAVASAVSFSDLVVGEEWNLFKLQFRKEYDNDAEEQFRMKIFMDNKLKISQHNKLYEQGLVSFTMKMNQFGDLLPREFNRMMNGYKMNVTNSNNPKQVTFIPPYNVTIPDEVDWRENGSVTSVKDQGKCGSGWAFSATGAMEGQHFRKTGDLVSLSEQNLVDCSKEYGNEGCNGGRPDAAFLYVQENGGIETEESYPYEDRDDDCRYDPATSGATVTNYVNVTGGNEDKLKAAVAIVGPISVAIDASHSSFHFYNSGVYYEPSCRRTKFNHAVLVVGYGTTNGTTNEGEDYWLVKNSYSESWGTSGYIKMARNKKNNCGIATEASYPLV